MKTAIELKADIEKYIAEAQASQMTRLAEVHNLDIPDEEKRSKALSILSEKYSVEAIVSNLKHCVQFNDELYEIPATIKRSTKSGGIGSTGKSGYAWKPGDKIKIVSLGQESEPYEVTEDLQVKNSAGEVLKASEAALLFKCEAKNMTVEQFNADFELRNGTKFQGYPGLSAAWWHKAE